RQLTSRGQKILYTAFVLFFYLYNGYGIGYRIGVYERFPVMYIVFLITLSLSYWLFLLVFRKEMRVAQEGTIPLIQRLFGNPLFAYITIGMYFATWLVRLVYPEFKLPLLINPPAPDVIGEFLGRFTAPPDAVTKLVSNAGFLLFPFFLIAVMRYRRNMLIFALLIFVPYYIKYCINSYISRGEVLAALFLVMGVQWYYNEKMRKYLIVGVLVILPFLPAMLVQYQDIRLQQGADLYIDNQDAIKMLVFSETNFPIYSDKVIRSGKHIDLNRYFIWMVTLPIPKAIIGSVNAPSAGMEMSEILLEKKQGRKGFFALLAGLLTESTYIYGTKWYFLHALFLGGLMAFIARLTENQDILFCVFLMLVVDLSYRLNRAGIAPVLGVVVNMYFSLYVLFFLGYLKRRIKWA
ncbi:MAG: hypothetical protein R3301_15430, partial [Saprospiraceae bacterium]|nr:hypothetical protein [Saprospiraceae bacterium]